VPIPVFAHVPMILGPDGRRLSKRHGATAIGEYRDQGILADAMVNFLALLGWSSGTDEEIFTAPNSSRASASTASTARAPSSTRRKLEWMNGRYLAEMPGEALVAALQAAVYPAAAERRPDWWLRLVDLLKVRSRSVHDMAEQAAPYVSDLIRYDEAAVARHWKDPDTLAPRLERLAERFASLDSFDEPAMEHALRALADEEGVGAGKVIHPLRVALTGAAASPGIFEVAALLGREQVLHRIDAAVGALRAPRDSGAH
jgi:glutamyl-tRNA synthetase